MLQSKLFTKTLKDAPKDEVSLNAALLTRGGLLVVTKRHELKFMAKQSKNKALAIFEGNQIRRHWDEEKESWYFSVVDVIAVLTDSENPPVYWRVLKKRLIDEGSGETVTKCNGLIRAGFIGSN